MKLVDDVEARLEVSVSILVGLDPALRDISSSLLHDGVEPGEGEDRLALSGAAAAAEGVRSPRVEGPLQVPLDAGRGLVGHLKARLAEDGGELGVRLRRQPKPGNEKVMTYDS